MTSNHSSAPSARPVRDKRTLQRLRREAGYRRAKDFAAEVGIPASTYARYERNPDGPACGIPMAAAWAIADKLGCSIDLVVGREDIDAPAPDSIQSRYDALTPEGRELVNGYLAYVEFGEQATSATQSRR